MAGSAPSPEARNLNGGLRRAAARAVPARYGEWAEGGSAAAGRMEPGEGRLAAKSWGCVARP